MCDDVKDFEVLRRQYNKAVIKNIEIIEIEMHSGNLRYRDRWSVKKIIDNEETKRGKLC